MILYQADWVCPATSPPIRNGCLAVDGNRITFVGASEIPEGDRVVHSGCAIVPGFVNAHTHLELTLFHGLLEGLSFSDWIVKLTRMKYQQCTREVLKLSAEFGVLEMLRAGVTTVGEVMDIGTGWEAMLEFGLQGVAYQEVFGPSESSAPDALEAIREKVARHRLYETETQRIGVSPHAPYTVSKTLYEGVRDFARRDNLRMTAHVAESVQETLFVRDGSGPFADNHRKRGIDVVPRHASPVAYLDQLGLLGPDMLLVHVIETNAEDLARILETRTHVVHCPRSNAYFGHGIAPVAAMRSMEIPVSLGTDSAASNEGFNMFAEMRAVVEQQRISFDEAFRMATIEGARALGLESRLGSLEPGKRADFAVVTLADPAGDPVADMIRSASPDSLKATVLGGREVVLDFERIRAEGELIREGLRSLG